MAPVILRYRALSEASFLLSCLTSAASGRVQRRLSLPVSGQLVRLWAGTALVRAKAGLTALWGNGTFHWYAYAPLSSSVAATR